MSLINISHLDIVFGKNQKIALSLLNEGQNRAFIKDKTACVVGVQDANLTINQGEIFVLMGLSGSGKSTLLRAINGLVSISRGDVHLSFEHKGILKNYDIKGASERTLRELRTLHVSMVFQSFALLPWRTVWENVAFGLEIARVPAVQRENRALKCLDLVGLSSWAKQMPSELSGGMQQRVGLARALATDADLLLMDEPFSALDPLIRSSLQQELLHLQRSLNKTVVFVTHDLDEAIRIGNRIAIMQDGKIIQVASPEEIIAHPKTTYVKEFVANVDQTKLLRAKAIMTAITDLKKDQTRNAVSLDEAGQIQCLLDDSGRPRRSLCKDIEGRIVPWTLFQSGSFTQNDIILGPDHLAVKDIITALSQTGRPMVIQDKSGRMIGVITAKSILNALALR